MVVARLVDSLAGPELGTLTGASLARPDEHVVALFVDERPLANRPMQNRSVPLLERTFPTVPVRKQPSNACNLLLAGSVKIFAVALAAADFFLLFSMHKTNKIPLRKIN